MPFAKGFEPHNKIHLDEALVLRMYDELGSTLKVAERFGCHKSIVVRIVKPVRKLRNPQPLSPGQVAAIEFLYGVHGYSGPQVARQVHTTPTAVYHYVRRAGIPVRKVEDYDYEAPCRHDFFDVIDTAEKAYWLGMLITDGCVSKNDEIILSLHPRDRAHVEAFRETLQSDAKISVHPPMLKKIGNRSWWVGSIAVCIKSHQLAAALARLGIVPAKTGHTYLPPGIPAELAPHFWRGAIDGDGWLAFGKRPNGRKQFVMGFTGNLALVQAFQDFCRKYTPTRANISPNHSIQRFVVTDWFAIDLVKMCYGSCGPALARKLEVYEAAIGDYSGRTRQQRCWAPRPTIQ